jgi:hypothetical protein
MGRWLQMTQDEYFRFLADCKPARTGTGGIPAASGSAPLVLYTDQG